ncbi:MAG: glycosyltransferase family 2 protein [Verrucomicrobiota bacterium]|nr:glycosyltransferase family 2 protein [Verrucomicrobiota bacterium]
MSFRTLVLIPSYNTGASLLQQTVQGAMTAGVPIWVMIDGSTDGSGEALAAWVQTIPQVTVHQLPVNRGKGATVREGALRALEAGFTHAVVMDADGQHPAEAIPRFIELAKRNPDAVIMGTPEFGPEAPKSRLYGRKLTIFWTDLETLWSGLGDTLFGFRLYPLAPLVAAMDNTSHARGFDFDPEVAVRLFWQGARPLNLPVTCRYLSKTEGGISHFHYLRDNLKLTWLHFRLIPEFILWQWVNALRTKRRSACLHVNECIS